MVRNQLTTAGELAVGDVFYKQADKKKNPLVVVFTTDGRRTAYRNPYKGAPKYRGTMLNNTPVVFLRSED